MFTSQIHQIINITNEHYTHSHAWIDVRCRGLHLACVFCHVCTQCPFKRNMHLNAFELGSHTVNVGLNIVSF